MKSNVRLVRGRFCRPRLGANVSICVRAGLPKPRGVPDTERIKDTNTLDYASTPLDANTLLPAVFLVQIQNCKTLLSARYKSTVL
jgi:hypothetical protein